jgi:hypothetical protein
MCYIHLSVAYKRTLRVKQNTIIEFNPSHDYTYGSDTRRGMNGGVHDALRYGE